MIDEKGNELAGPAEGFLVLKVPHPGICRSIYGGQVSPATAQGTFIRLFPHCDSSKTTLFLSFYVFISILIFML